MRRPEAQIRAADNTSAQENDIGETAVFFDFENIVLGVKEKFDPGRVLEHLASRGDVLIRRAYADWSRFSRYQSKLLELGVEMVFLPSYGVSDKNRTDTAVCVDAMEILFTRPNIETFVIVSGDSDFGVLARRLRSYGKRVLGISARSSASKILASICHEFIFYEGLTGQALSGITAADGEALLRRVIPNISAEAFQPSLLKDRLRKLDSTFSERNYGFPSFLKFLESYPHLFKIERFGRGRTEVTIREDADKGGRSKPPPARSRQPKAAPAPKPERKPAAKTERKPAAKTERKPSSTQERDTKVRKDALNACRTLLEAVLPSEEVTLNRIKSKMLEAVPTFNHTKLGYRTFIDFLRDQPDLVTVTRNGRRIRVSKAA